MPVILSWTSTTGLRKTNEDSNLPIEKCQNSKLSGALGSLVLLLQLLGFVINNEKSQFQPVQEIKVLGLVINSISVT